jgi:YVTN family beta-propeller protein
VVDIETGTVVLMPCSETARHLTYNARLSELWSTCSTFGGCDPFRIDVFDAVTLKRKTTILGPGYLPDGSRPAFSQNGAYYYQPHWGNDVVLVFDAVTKAFVTQIPVGSNPRNVYMQGDSTPEEY